MIGTYIILLSCRWWPLCWPGSGTSHPFTLHIYFGLQLCLHLLFVTDYFFPEFIEQLILELSGAHLQFLFEISYFLAEVFQRFSIWDLKLLLFLQLLVLLKRSGQNGFDLSRIVTLVLLLGLFHLVQLVDVFWFDSTCRNAFFGSVLDT